LTKSSLASACIWRIASVLRTCAPIWPYGKVIGGGISIGAVCGDPKYMDALDGGQWNYGTTRSRKVGVTFFAGTFVRHPLALGAAKGRVVPPQRAGAGASKKPDGEDGAACE